MMAPSYLRGVILGKQMVKKVPTLTPAMQIRRLISSGHNSYGQQPPEPLPNRPLRGERPHQPNSDHSFLKQFKLQNRKETPVREQPQSQPLPPPPEDANEIFKKMKETGLIPNAVSMLDGLCKDSLVHEAMKLFGLIREKGTLPEVVIYTAVVEAFCKAHNFEEAKRIFRKMQNNGVNPNAFSYTVMIQGLYKCNKVDDAVGFCVEMLEEGHSPNVATFVGLVEMLSREKGVEEAEATVDILKQKGFVVNAKAVKDFMEKKAPFPSLAFQAIFKKKPNEKPF
ncbi:PREDICTED: pentatricopeptide repeat-containing protein At4g38150 [Tarenaya hassleriana]|uniref:pentatricopeptide repeat-containing protein At4g38150 n=1 Tax=Tarenaya hassleriana TaxID=28532 RepID=UPI00053C1858|nr:PREDICTED: pentatricopeptide repeat-containing protein At4g38150 [Tarenaya hassleriana]